MQNFGAERLIYYKKFLFYNQRNIHKSYVPGTFGQFHMSTTQLLIMQM